MSEGYIKLFRKITDWDWYQDANAFRLFLHLLLVANHKPRKVRGVMVNRGQVLTGRKQLSVELDISERAIRTTLEKLQRTNEVSISPSNKHSLITLLNYEHYQSSPEKEQKRRPADRPTNRPENDQLEPLVQQGSSGNGDQQIDQQIVQQSTSMRPTNRPTIDQQNANKQADERPAKRPENDQLEPLVQQGLSGNGDQQNANKTSIERPAISPENDRQIDQPEATNKKKRSKDHIYNERTFLTDDFQPTDEVVARLRMAGVSHESVFDPAMIQEFICHYTGKNKIYAQDWQRVYASWIIKRERGGYANNSKQSRQNNSADQAFDNLDRIIEESEHEILRSQSRRQTENGDVLEGSYIDLASCEKSARFGTS